MSIQASSVTTKAVRLKSPSGSFLEATAVTYSSGTGEAVFSLSKPYSVLDDGIWEIYSADTDRISDTAGNSLAANQKLGEFTVGEVDPTEDAIAKADAEIAALKAKQDAQVLALQKATQSVADLAILVAGGVGGASSTELKSLQDKLTALDTAKADKAALNTLDTTVTALKTALSDGATDKELTDAIAKVDAAIALIEADLKPLAKRTIYTGATVINAIVGDEIHIDGDGDIQLIAAPADGAEVRIFDELGKIRAGENNVLLGVGDRWLMPDGSFDATAMEFTDNELRQGWVRLKYSAPTKSWRPYVVYGTQSQAPSPTTGLKPAILTDDIGITANPFNVIHLKGTGNIQIGTFGELEYFEVQWIGPHDVTVLRPVGFTINGTDDDFQLDTANMGVSRVRFTLIETNFEVV